MTTCSFKHTPFSIKHIVALVCLTLIPSILWLSVNNETSNRLLAPVILATASQHFYPVNEKGVHHFKNVCIEHWADSVDGKRPHNTYYCNKGNRACRIVVYDKTAQFSKQGLANITVFFRETQSAWQLEFTEEPVPTTHQFVDGVVAAYFLQSRCAHHNLYHFWEDHFRHLFDVMRRTGGLRLKPGLTNRIVYNRMGSEHSCFNRTGYRDILETLPLDSRPESFWLTKTNSCFVNGVFSGRVFNGTTTTSELVKYVGNKMHIIPTVQEGVVIIQRRERRLINAEQMLDTAGDLYGAGRVRIVDFEDLDVTAQMKVVTESCVLVGVQGAGLHWAMLYEGREDTTLIEIAWPIRRWQFTYSRRFRGKIQTLKLPIRSSDVHVNWTSYERNVHQGRKLSDVERQMVRHSNISTDIHHSIWKWADVTVDLNLFRKLLRQTKCSQRMLQSKR